MKLNSFKDLKVWQLSHKLSIEVAKLVKNFPKDEKYDLGDQMRRSSRSVPSAIAEGFGSDFDRTERGRITPDKIKP